jgi:hypothetical protein
MTGKELTKGVLEVLLEGELSIYGCATRLLVSLARFRKEPENLSMPGSRRYPYES